METLPATRYAVTRDGVHIAYQVFGATGPDVIVVPGFISHLETMWEWPPLADLYKRLGSVARVIMFDKRGTGMSDHTARLPDIDQRMLDVLGVMDTVGSAKASLLGISEGGAMAILFAATHPERTDSLALFGSYAKPTRSEDHPMGVDPAVLTATGDYLEPRWGSGVGLAAWAPSLAQDPLARSFWGKLQRRSASPGAARLLLTSYTDIDVRPALPLIQAPTLVTHRTGDRMVSIELGREVAAGIPGARFMEVPGDDHLLTMDTGGDQIIDEIATFLTGAAPVAESERVLATVLFTDIVDSTRLVSAVGDTRWRDRLDEHDRLVRSIVSGTGGDIVKDTGDGVLARFTGPTRAVRAALAITAAAPGAGLQVRAGLHTGELVERGDDVSGLAVHIAQRVSALASAGEVLASRTVVDLVAGSGLEFEDRGQQQLKGVDGSWHVYAALPG